MDECPLPVQFSLGQGYPNRCPSTATSSSLSSSSSVASSGDARPANDLRKIAVPWYSPVPLTATQLARKRCEFWETVPAYGGSVEVWQALQSAVEIGHADIETARMILACAGVSTPNGSLTEAYDDLGYRYSVPSYCLADPSNGLAPPPEGKEESVISNDQYDDLSLLGSDLSTTIIKMRLSTGEDVSLNAPLSDQLCIGHIRRITKDHLHTDGRIEFFWAGHGPLPASTKLASLGDKYGATKPLLQAWLFPNTRDEVQSLGDI